MFSVGETVGNAVVTSVGKGALGDPERPFITLRYGGENHTVALPVKGPMASREKVSQQIVAWAKES